MTNGFMGKAAIRFLNQADVVHREARISITELPASTSSNPQLLVRHRIIQLPFSHKML